MAHGFGAVKEQCLDDYATVFARAGFVVLVYDNRNFGDSGGHVLHVAAFDRRVSPTPLLMIVALFDTGAEADMALRAYVRALPPKQLITLACTHFEPCVEHFAASSGQACDRFKQHLLPSVQPMPRIHSGTS